MRERQNKLRNQFRIYKDSLHDILLSVEQTIIPKTEYDFQWALEGASPEQQNCVGITRQMPVSMQYGCRVRRDVKRNILYIFNPYPANVDNMAGTYQC